MTFGAPSAAEQAATGSFRSQVRSAVIWRSGTQIFAQLVAWISTFLVIRILTPADYGLFAMTSVVLVLLTLFNGMGFVTAAIQQRDGGERQLRQLFGLLLLFNGALAAIQVLVAPLIAAYYRQPIIADLLRVQALIYLTNPFYGLGYAVLTREMDFRRQGHVNIASALVGALAALGGALAGWGVWTLVYAPLAGFAVRGLGMLLAARAFIRPSFDFRGAQALTGAGGIIIAGHLFWFVQTQADIVIAGRLLSPTEIGFYSTALFLAQLFVNKVVPPLNEVAFSAYAQIQDDVTAVAQGFLKSVRVVMLLAVPFCLGLASVAEPAVAVMLGEKWLPSAPLVSLLALAMPFMTLHVMFAPALNAIGKSGIVTRGTVFGAVLLPAAYLVGASLAGAKGLALAWLLGFPVLTAVTAFWTLRAIAVSPAQLVHALAPPCLAGLGMALTVAAVDMFTAEPASPLRLAALVASGGLVYGLWLQLFARERLDELFGLIRR